MAEDLKQDINSGGLFSRLTRLFSTDVVIRNVGGNQLKVIDVDRIQAYGNVKTNALIDRFTKLHRYGANMPYNPTMNYQTLRIQLYTDYEAMDTESIIASSLDIIADEATLKNEANEVLQIRSADENVQRILYNLFYDVLNVEFNLWMWVRNMCKYGDFYLHLEIAEKFGIYNVTPMSVYDMVREEGADPQNPSYVCFRIDPMVIAAGGINSRIKDRDGKIKFENYEIAHFRLLTDANYLPYGRSYIEPARKTYKQYVLMKDAMLLHRITRAPEKRVFYVDIGNMPPAEVDAYMERLKQKMQKTPYIDKNTGEYNLKYNMMNVMEDFYIPQRGANSNTKIDTLKGLEYQAIDDVNFLRDEMLAALKVPKAFFGFEKDLTGKATLAAEDIRFARTVERIQRIILSELYKIALVHLYVQGYDGESLSNFELHLSTPSVIYEQEKVALWKEKISLAKEIQDTKLLPSDWIYDNVFQFSEDQYDEYRDLVAEDMKRTFRLGQIENEGNDPAKSGKSYGTPHDLASMYGTGRYNSTKKENVPPGYDETRSVGRPQEKSSIIGTQKDPLGKDRLGSKENSTLYTANIPDEGSGTPKGGSPLALAESLRHKDMLKNIPRPNKDIVFKNEPESTLLDEKNIRDI
jgi:hypothetical protein